MAFVRILVSFATLDATYAAGDIVELPLGADWVTAGLAELIPEPASAVEPEPPAEPAPPAEPEPPASRSRRRKG